MSTGQARYLVVKGITLSTSRVFGGLVLLDVDDPVALTRENARELAGALLILAGESENVHV